MKSNNILILERERLNNKLSMGLHMPLTIVTSAMGYGKTTAVKTFLSKQDNPVIWATMTEAISIARSEYFWMILTKEISRYDGALGDEFSTRGFPCDSAQMFRFIEMLRDYKISQGSYVILVIDDYFLIENKEINYLIERIAKAELDWLRMIIISRRMPKLCVGELISKNFCSTIESEDLKFTYDEVENYFQLIGFSCDDAIKESIYFKSDGWITALYLITKNYSQGDYLLTTTIQDMLRDSLFERYNEEMKETLVQLSIFDRITSEQAIYIFNDSNMGLKLEELLKDNAFISKDSDKNYSFHQIFLDFLREEQVNYQFNIMSIYRRASEWFATHGDHMMAFHYGLLSQNYHDILGLLDRADISSINSIDRKLIFPVFNEIEEKQWYEFPLATLKYIFLLILSRNYAKAEYVLNCFEHYFQENEHEKYSQRQLLAEAQITRTSLSFNNISDIVKHSKKAYELLDGKNSLTRGRNSVYTYGCPHFSYLYYKTPGQYASVIKTIQEGFFYHVKATEGCGAGAVSLSSAEFSLETGRLEIVEGQAMTALHYAESHEQTCIVAASMLTLGRLYQMSKRIENLDQIINRLEEMRRSEKNPLNSDVLDNAVGYLYALLGQMEKVPKWIRTGDSTYCSSIYQCTAFDLMVYQMVLIRQNKYESFKEHSESFLFAFNQFHNVLGIVLFHINYAIALFYLEGIESAEQEMEKALQIAQKDKLVTLFVENAAYIRPILENGVFNVETDFLKKIINACEENADIASKKNKLSTLSNKEIEVIELLQEGFTVEEIGNKLYISKNTVKRHLQNIYHKLGVHNKTTAIKKYLELCKNDSDSA